MRHACRWDDEAVSSAFALLRKDIRAQRSSGSGQISEEDIARWLAVHEPANWKPTTMLAVEGWSVAWANEILPLAREAHERLTFTHIKLHPTTKTATGQAIEKTQGITEAYDNWAGKVVQDELHKAGWRLAALLDAALN